MQKEKDKKKEGNLSHFVSGSISGVITTLLFQPLDYVKTRLQVVYGKNSNGIGSSMDIVKSTIKERGLGGLWRGTGPTIWRIVPGAGLYFAALNYMTVFFKERSGKVKLSTAETLFVGASSRGAIGFLLCPITVVKARMEATSVAALPFKTTASGLVYIFKNEGVRGLFKGSVASVARDSPYSASYLVFYESSKTGLNQFFQMKKNDDNVYNGHFSVNLVAGAVAGSLSTALTHPFDVIKTRQQTRTSTSGFMQVMTETWRNESLNGFYKGLVPRMVRKAGNSAILWAGYEEILKALLHRHS